VNVRKRERADREVGDEEGTRDVKKGKTRREQGSGER